MCSRKQQCCTTANNTSAQVLKRKHSHPVMSLGIGRHPPPALRHHRLQGKMSLFNTLSGLMAALVGTDIWHVLGRAHHAPYGICLVLHEKTGPEAGQLKKSPHDAGFFISSAFPVGRTEVRPAPEKFRKENQPYGSRFIGFERCDSHSLLMAQVLWAARLPVKTPAWPPGTI